MTVINPAVEPAVSLETTTGIALILEYDGTRYHGFQLQSSLPTIQKEVEEALGKLTGERIRVISAGRTDAGVHARGQVVSFQTGSSLPPQTFVSGLNYYLPRDIAVKSAHRTSGSFSARRHAISREYRYSILNSPTRSPLKEDFTYRLNGHLDIDAMNRAAQALIGEHDFASFTSSNEVSIKSTVRRVYRAEITREAELVVFYMVANSFLLHQVRNTIGSLIKVGQGKMHCDEFYSIIAMKQSGMAGPMAPASGLCLAQVNYFSPFEDGIYDKNV